MSTSHDNQALHYCIKAVFELVHVCMHGQRETSQWEYQTCMHVLTLNATDVRVVMWWFAHADMMCYYTMYDVVRGLCHGRKYV